MRIIILLLLSAITQFCIGGTITIGSGSISSFGNCYPFHSSTAQRYTVSATALTANLLITAPNGFEVSLEYKQRYSSSVTLVPVSGNITTTTVYIRFSPSATGSFSSNVVNSSTGSTSQNIAVSGTGINWAIPTSPSNYYSTATGTGASLKTALYNKITGHSAQGYTPGVWNAFATTDIQPNGKVWDIYSTKFETASPYEFTLVTDQDNGSGGSSEGQKYNREHSFPQSWFGSSSPMVSDLHHVFATDKYVNGQRGDLPYGTVSTPNWTSSIGGKRGPNTSGSFTGTAFEPVDEYKGDVARAQLYMATRYDNVIASWQPNATADNVLDGTTFPAYDAWFLNLLITWHNLDPVSDKEIKRNNAIYALQNNRNPFIDSPQFVKKIWGGAIPAEPTVNAISLSFSNKTNTSMQINWASGNGSNRLVVMRASTTSAVPPADSTRYIANTVFGSGSQTGAGNYVIYNGSGSTVSVTGLTMGVNYTITVYEYNGWYNTSNYQTTGALSSNSSTLPVEWMGFTATKESDKQITLQWQTASELNNHHFDIERSVNLVSFEKIGEVAGAGNSNTPKQYVFSDDTLKNNPNLSGTLYYRIKQVDADGAFSYSDTETISTNTGIGYLPEDIFQLSPNPFSNNLRISFSTQTQPLEITLFDMSGKVLLKQYEHETAKNEIIITGLGHLHPGLYWLQIKSASGNSKNTKLIKN